MAVFEMTFVAKLSHKYDIDELYECSVKFHNKIIALVKENNFAEHVDAKNSPSISTLKMFSRVVLLDNCRLNAIIFVWRFLHDCSAWISSVQCASIFPVKLYHKLKNISVMRRRLLVNECKYWTGAALPNVFF